MDRTAIAEQLVALIRRHTVVRSNALAAMCHADVTEADVVALLQPLVDAGQLVTCSVQLVGDQRVTEYRLAAAGGGVVKAPNYRAYVQPRPKPAATPTPQPAPQQLHQGEAVTMTVKEQILAAIGKHGPLNLPDLQKRLNKKNLSPTLAEMVNDGQLDKEQRRGGAYSLHGARPPAPRPGTPDTKKKDEAAAFFSITNHGDIAIHKGEDSVVLDATEFTQLRKFTEQSEGIWKEAA